MKKIAVIYWSGTGNTQMMAEAVAQGAGKEGIDVRLIPVGQASKADVLDAGAVAFGCPSMGNEVLEEFDMEPFISSLQGTDLAAKPLVLFGSYDWGSGQWMRDWEDRMKGQGAQLLADGLTVQNTPDDAALATCRELGAKLTGAVA